MNPHTNYAVLSERQAIDRLRDKIITEACEYMKEHPYAFVSAEGEAKFRQAMKEAVL